MYLFVKVCSCVKLHPKIVANRCILGVIYKLKNLYPTQSNLGMCFLFFLLIIFLKFVTINVYKIT